MKTIYSLLAIAVLLSVSCVKEEMQHNPEHTESVTLALEGSFSPSTRISVGDVSGDAYPVSWTEGDAVGIFSITEGADIENVAARLDASTAGQPSGKFNAQDPISFPEGKSAELLIYYPYNELAVLEGTSLKTIIPAEQTAAANTTEHLGKYTFAYSSAEVEKESDLVRFQMKHAAAYARVVISTTDFAGYNLKSVVLRDLTGGIALSDTVSVDLKTGNLTNGLAPKSYVRAELSTPHVLTADPVEVWISAFPADFRTTPLYVAVEMEAADGSKTVTIPVKCNGELKANAVNTLEIANLSLSDNELTWYEPQETRFLAGGWAYGDVNCVLNVDPKDLSVSSQEVSVKARGNFAHVHRPAYAAIILGEHNNNKKTTYLNGDNTLNKAVTIPDSYTLTLGSRGEQKTVTAEDGTETYTTNDQTLGIGEVAIYAEDEVTILWTFAVWGVGTNIKHVTYKSGLQVMDRNLGSRNSNWNDWKNGGCYYQWGRPTPFGWSPNNKEDKQHAEGISEADALAGKYSLSYILSRPNRKFSPLEAFANSNQDWHVGSGTGVLSDRNQGLWGNPDPDSPDGGKKSVYDPCPKGYRVISPAIVKELEGAALELVRNADKKLDYFKYTIDENNVDYINTGGGWTLWDWRGGIAGFARTAIPQDFNSDANINGVNTKTIATLWSNAPAAVDSHQACAFAMLHPECNHEGAEKVRPAADWVTNKGGRANAWHVRCMVDTENR